MYVYVRMFLWGGVRARVCVCVCVCVWYKNMKYYMQA